MDNASLHQLKPRKGPYEILTSLPHFLLTKTVELIEGAKSVLTQ